MKLTLDSIRQITVFENVTKAMVKDCIEREDSLLFIVEEGNVQKALGKDNMNIRKLEHMLKRKIIVIGFQKDPSKFVRNLIYPIRVESIREEGKIITIKAGDTKTKGKIFGREKSNLKWMNELVGKYFKEYTVQVE